MDDMNICFLLSNLPVVPESSNILTYQKGEITS